MALSEHRCGNASVWSAQTAITQALFEKGEAITVGTE
jgi:hypothetical protein